MNSYTQKSILLFAFVAAALVANAQEINKTFSGVKKIKINTSSGDLILAKGSSNDVQVKVTFTYGTDEYQPVFEQSGSTLTLKEDFNKRSVSGKSTWTLTIPDGLELRASSGSRSRRSARRALPSAWLSSGWQSEHGPSRSGRAWTWPEAGSRFCLQDEAGWDGKRALRQASCRSRTAPLPIPPGGRS